MKVELFEGLEMKVTKKGNWKMKIAVNEVGEKDVYEFLEFAKAWEDLGSKAFDTLRCEVEHYRKEMEHWKKLAEERMEEVQKRGEQRERLRRKIDGMEGNYSDIIEQGRERIRGLSSKLNLAESDNEELNKKILELTEVYRVLEEGFKIQSRDNRKEILELKEHLRTRQEIIAWQAEKLFEAEIL